MLSPKFLKDYKKKIRLITLLFYMCMVLIINKDKLASLKIVRVKHLY
jgi:hypothetical protein